MSTPRVTKAIGPPSATPTEAERAAWAALSRDEQIQLTSAALNHPDCSSVATESMSEILEKARRQVAARAHG